MSIIGAGLLFVALILVYIIIVEIFTVLFRLTGFPTEKARFQVVSLLTNSGYTTKESELVTASPIRRKLARITMMFGYAFTVTIVSSVVNIFLALKLTEMKHLAWQLSVPAGILIAAMLLFRNGIGRRWLDVAVSYIVEHIALKTNQNQLMVMDYFADQAMVQVSLRQVPEKLKQMRLAETDLKRLNILLVLVQHKGMRYETADGDTILHAGDQLVAFGSLDTLTETFEATSRFVQRESAGVTSID